MTIKVPASLNIEESLKLFQELDALPYQEQYKIDFTALQHMPPFGAILVSSFLRQFIQRRHLEHIEKGLPEASFVADGFQGKSYASHIGFFKSFNLDYGKEPGEARGSQTYLPIKRIKIRNLKFRASHGFTDVGDEIVEESRAIASILTMGQEGDLYQTLVYSFTEIFRNTVEHSSADSIWYSAQCWPTRNLVEIAILDEGVGIYKSLSSNPDLQIQDECHALYLSLMPGISRNVRLNGRRVNQLSSETGWSNSGFGLYMTSQISGNNSGFMILSGASAISIVRGTPRPFTTPRVNGTAIRIKLDTSQLTSLETQLAALRDKARGKFGSDDVASRSSTARYLFGN